MAKSSGSQNRTWQSAFRVAPILLMLLSSQPLFAGICTEQSGCAMPVGQVVTQESAPFRFLGKIVDEDHPQWSNYKRSIKRYHSPIDCLSEREQQEETANLVALDWKRVGTGRGAEVCIFRILSSLEDRDDILFWLEAHDFATRGFGRKSPETIKPRFPTEGVVDIGGLWSVDQYRSVNPSLLASIGIEFVHNYQLIINLDQNDQIVGVNVVTPAK